MYGICLFLGIFSATLVGERLCKKRNLDTQIYWRAVFYALLLGLLGARLYHVIHRFDYFIQHPQEIIAIWQGGLGIWGGVFGGLLGLILSTRKTGKLIAYADIFAVGAPLAQAIGRWGNYFNKELFGYPTNLPWGIYIPQEFRPSAYKYYDHFHPLFLYESLFDFILFILLYKFFTKKKISGVWQPSGTVTLMYLAGYSCIRFFFEFLRFNAWSISGLPVASILSALVLLISVLVIYRRTTAAN